MKHLKNIRFTIILITILATLVVPTSEAASPPSSIHCGRWSIIPSPSPGGNPSDSLTGVVAITSTNVWAVGFTYNTTLVEHWDGTRWSVVPSPSPAPNASLYAVASVPGTNELWAVGDYGTYGIGPVLTLVEHWDGKRWSVVPSPDMGMTNNSYTNYLAGVLVLSTTNIWAVGAYSIVNGAFQTLIEHWNGIIWQIVPSPNVRSAVFSKLQGIAALSANDIWAIGYYDTPNNAYPLFEHWNGTKWSIVKKVRPFIAGGLNGITTIPGSRDLLAVGNSGVNTYPLIEHWNGTLWQTTFGAKYRYADASSLNSVVAHSASDVWAVGSTTVKTSDDTLIEHWNGKHWRVVPSPNPYNNDDLNAVGTVPGTTELWAVGVANGRSNTLIEHYC